MRLSEILKNVSLLEVCGSMDVEITGVNIDSRKVVEGNLFVAIKGTQADGHAYIDRAVQQGAAAILLCNSMPTEKPARS